MCCMAMSELGEVCSFFQKERQGHEIDHQKLKLELGDLMFAVNELISFTGNNANEVAQLNIRKLRQRYPNGFEEAKSVNRSE
ncbi:MAG: hypothetical protein GYA87_01965 [Christensenellaceae bacterium]|nr:hypothetical protein [Christensenellaceae bacterium]